MIFFLPILFSLISYNDVTLISIYDGDTIKVDLSCEDTLYCKSLSVRIKGIDTPEIRGKCESEKKQAIKARDYLYSLLNKKKIILRECERGKFFRIACKVFVDQQNVAKRLIKKKLGRIYDGKTKRKTWCK